MRSEVGTYEVFYFCVRFLQLVDTAEDARGEVLSRLFVLEGRREGVVKRFIREIHLVTCSLGLHWLWIPLETRDVAPFHLFDAF